MLMFSYINRYKCYLYVPSALTKLLFTVLKIFCVSIGRTFVKFVVTIKSSLVFNYFFESSSSFRNNFGMNGTWCNRINIDSLTFDLKSCSKLFQYPITSIPFSFVNCTRNHWGMALPLISLSFLLAKINAN